MRASPRGGRSCLAGLFALCLALPLPAYAHGDLHVRIAALTKDIAAQPERAELYLQRGELHRLHEDWNLAEADYQRAEKLDAKLATVWLGRSRLLLTRNRFKEAEQEVARYLAVHPRDSAGLMIRAQALAGSKRHREAAETWALVIETTAKPDVEHYYGRAQALAAMGEDQIDAALRALDEGITKLGKVPALGLSAIELEAKRKRYDAALARVDAFMPKTGRKETWLELRGDLLASAGQSAEAQKAYASALADLKSLPPRTRTTKAGMELEARLLKKAQTPR